ncbi:MAG: hypothetical protein ACQESR_11135 [Planctomycetota bacterium]
MWRSLFLAMGIVLCILGAECLVLEKAVLARNDEQPKQTTSYLAPAPEPSREEFKPPEWLPWGLLSFGAVVILYSYSLPRRNA